MIEGRVSTAHRATAETSVEVTLNLDGTGRADLDTGLPFFNHLLHQVACHGGFNLAVRASGDDQHHLVEDTGIVLGQALRQAIGDVSGLARYGQAAVPMDESLAEAVLDISGRPFLAFDVEFPRASVGGFDLELVEEFFRALSVHAGLTLHLAVRRGGNAHHMAEALFKAFGRALRAAVRREGSPGAIPSTKGTLS